MGTIEATKYLPQQSPPPPTPLLQSDRALPVQKTLGHCDVCQSVKKDLIEAKETQ
jgi:hypothetical protein